MPTRVHPHSGRAPDTSHYSIGNTRLPFSAPGIGKVRIGALGGSLPFPLIRQTDLEAEPPAQPAAEGCGVVLRTVGSGVVAVGADAAGDGIFCVQVGPPFLGAEPIRCVDKRRKLGMGDRVGDHVEPGDL